MLSVIIKVPATQRNTANITQAIKKFDQYKHSELVGAAPVVGDPLFEEDDMNKLIITTFKQLLSIYQPVIAAVSAERQVWN